jgi:L-alanine-DL-glutamate epimerase-like enolase superfamily enzyme
MAERAGLPVTLHLSGGLGFADMVHFASYVPNIGPYAEAASYRPAADQEYKGSVPEAGAWFEPPIRLADGALTIPTAPGLGLRSDLVGGWTVGSRLRDELKRAKGVRA